MEHLRSWPSGFSGAIPPLSEENSCILSKPSRFREIDERISFILQINRNSADFIDYRRKNFLYSGLLAPNSRIEEKNSSILRDRPDQDHPVILAPPVHRIIPPHPAQSNQLVPSCPIQPSSPIRPDLPSNLNPPGRPPLPCSAKCRRSPPSAPASAGRIPSLSPLLPPARRS